jgi:hypothetical protein
MSTWEEVLKLASLSEAEYGAAYAFVDDDQELQTKLVAFHASNPAIAALAPYIKQKCSRGQGSSFLYRNFPL